MLSRRELFYFGGATAIAKFANNAARATIDRGLHSFGQLQLGLFGPTYFAGMCPLINWWKVGVTDGNYVITLSNGSTVTVPELWTGRWLDPATGDLMSPVPPNVSRVNRIFFAPPGNDAGVMKAAGCDYSGEEWTIEYDGAGASVNIQGQIKKSIRETKFTVRPSTSPANLQIRIDNWTNRNDPPRNFRCYQSRYEANAKRGEIFNPDYVELIRPFGILRFMDWQATNNSVIVNFSDLAPETFFSQFSNPPADRSQPYASIHPSLICKLANLTNCNIHVCIPHQATDAFVVAFSTYIRDHLSPDLTCSYEYTNEPWNGIFAQSSYCTTQGAALFGGGDTARGFKWYGYRSAQCMKIIRDIYGISRRDKWRGVLATQTANVGVLDYNIIGVKFYLTKVLSNSLTVSDLYDDLEVTGYFALSGTQVRSRGISSISQANPGVVTSPSHDWLTGQRIKIFCQNGMKQVGNRYFTITKIDNDHFSIGVDTTNYNTFIPGKNFAMDAAIFEVMDDSYTKFVNEPSRYRTKYQYFNEQLAAAISTGSSSAGLTNSSPLSNYDASKNGYWTQAMTRAVSNGLQLLQYEGGYSFAGSVYQTEANNVSAYPQFVEYMVSAAFSAEIARVSTDLMNRFINIGGKFPSKFVDGGLSSAYGAWGGIRFLPLTANHNSSDASNALWQSLLALNARSAHR